MLTRLRSGAGTRKNYRSIAGLTRTRGSAAKPKLAPRVRKAVAKVAKAVLSKNVETKHVGQNVINAAFNQTISSASEMYRVLPDVTEGTAGHQRDGDKIRPKYLIVKGHIQIDDSYKDTYLPPTTLRVMILTQRNIKSSADLSRADYAHLLKDNVGTDVARPYGGGIFDNLAPINKDLFTVLMDRKFKMREHMAAALGTTGVPISVQGTQRTISFVKKIKCPSTLHFDDGNGNTPNNFAPFFCMGAVSDDNSGAISLSTPYRATVLSELYFTDA